MSLPGGRRYSHLHYVWVCMRALPGTHTCACTTPGFTQFRWSCRPQGTGQDGRFMFSVGQTWFSRLAPSSLGLLHGHTCYSNKLPRAPLESLMDSRGGGASLLHACGPEETSRPFQMTHIHRGRKRKLFDHPSWLGAFIRPQQFNDPLTDARGMLPKLKCFPCCCKRPRLGELPLAAKRGRVCGFPSPPDTERAFSVQGECGTGKNKQTDDLF